MPTVTARRRLAALVLAAATLSAIGLVAAGTPPVNAACSISVRLGLGSTGDAVRCLQQTLNSKGVNSGPVDGQFGPMTSAAVTGYQRANGLYVDGIVGPQTGGSLGIWGATTTPPAAATTPTPPTTTPARSAVGSYTIASGDTLYGIAAKTATPIDTLLSLNGLRLSSLILPGQVLRVSGSTPAAPAPTPTPTAPAPADTTDYTVVSGDSLYGIAAKSGTPIDTLLALNGLSLTTLIHPGQVLRVSGSAPSGGGSAAGNSCAPPSGVPASARQVVVVDSSGSTADVDLLVHDGSQWTCARTDMYGRVGRNGVRTLSQRRSGDGTTPGGVFPLASMTAADGQTFQFFGNGANPGVQGAWRQVRSGDCWVATPGDPAYNTLVTRTASNCTAPDEYLPNFQNAYSRAALIGANMGTNRSGDQSGEPALAAAIFLHRHSYNGDGSTRPTAGCVSLSSENLIAVLPALVPGQAYFVIT